MHEKQSLTLSQGGKRLNDVVHTPHPSCPLPRQVLRQVQTMVPSMPGPLESWERAETLEIAHSKGIDKVRGHAWTMVTFTKSKRESFIEQVCEWKDLCRACGESGHMISACSRRGARAAWMGDGGRHGGGDGDGGDDANAR